MGYSQSWIGKEEVGTGTVSERAFAWKKGRCAGESFLPISKETKTTLRVISQ